MTPMERLLGSVRVPRVSWSRRRTSMPLVAPASTAEFWARVSEAFSIAIEAQPEERQQFLYRLRKGAADVEGEVRKLLAQAERPAEFLENPVLSRVPHYGSVRVIRCRKATGSADVS